MDLSPKTPFYSLPVEILQQILRCAPDVASLKSLVLASSRFYYAFGGAKSTIIHQVLLNSLGQDLLSHALATLEAAKKKTLSNGEVERFNIYCSNLKEASPAYFSALTWKPKDAAMIARLYDHVQALASDMASTCLLNFKKKYPHADVSRPLSDGEVTRFQHAFYRFEIYCILFHDKNLYFDGDDDLIKTHCDYFAHWENEQFGCVYDYLYKRVNSVLNTLGPHLPGPLSLFEQVDAPYLQYHLSLGLHHLRPLLAANSREECSRLIGDEMSQDYVEFLQEVFIGVLKPMREVLLDQVEDPKAPYFRGDSDSGPKSISIWASNADDPYSFGASYWQLRSWGYVLWDQARLDSWGVLQDPWRRPDDDDDGLADFTPYGLEYLDFPLSSPSG
ncbi:hypothetical protein FQN57_001640 [Myotisia sp. PD_48]|nr:hypothetical protein FQN57_001640 [Myotisia sp. PD_48]